MTRWRTRINPDWGKHIDTRGPGDPELLLTLRNERAEMLCDQAGQRALGGPYQVVRGADGAPAIAHVNGVLASEQELEYLVTFEHVGHRSAGVTEDEAQKREAAAAEEAINEIKGDFDEWERKLAERLNTRHVDAVDDLLGDLQLLLRMHHEQTVLTGHTNPEEAAVDMLEQMDRVLEHKRAELRDPATKPVMHTALGFDRRDESE